MNPPDRKLLERMRMPYFCIDGPRLRINRQIGLLPIRTQHPADAWKAVLAVRPWGRLCQVRAAQPRQFDINVKEYL